MTIRIIVEIRNRTRLLVVEAIRQFYNRFWGMKIGSGCIISLGAKLDKSNPKGVEIGEYTAIAFGSAILTHDWVGQAHKTTRIGKQCFIGCNVLVLPGITIGDNCIIGAGSVVMTNIPDGSVVLGNPARIVERNVMTTNWGVRVRTA